jgi:hypothetical protein
MQGCKHKWHRNSVKRTGYGTSLQAKTVLKNGNLSEPSFSQSSDIYRRNNFRTIALWLELM